MVPESQQVISRPRVEGAREHALFEATLQLLTTTGYDRLTMDAVASLAHASKATLYRRWSSKADLVVDSIVWLKDCLGDDVPDTGSLRGDILGVACGEGGLTDKMPLAVFGSLITAMQCNADLAEAFQQRFMGPMGARAQCILQRACDRGEIGEDVDLELLQMIVPAMVIFRALTTGQPATPDLIERIVDQIMIPASRGQGGAA